MTNAHTSPSLAVAELRTLTTCSDKEAAAWLQHRLDCSHSWPLSVDDLTVLTMLNSMFADVARPEHFTDPTHCEECADHERMLQQRTPWTLRREDLGTPGWDPISFTDAQGIAWLFPALARFALLPPMAQRGYELYASQLVRHLSRDDKENAFLCWCSDGQRAAVLSLLEHLLVTRIDNFTDSSSLDDLSAALYLWQKTPRVE